MKPNYHYNPKLRGYAHSNRQSMTKAEACLWKYALSKRQMLGYQFRRQRPIENYIVDFICLPIKLVIEVDGYSHQLTENEAKDRVRQNQHINIVRENIQGWIEKLSLKLGNET